MFTTKCKYVLMSVEKLIPTEYVTLYVPYSAEGSDVFDQIYHTYPVFDQIYHSSDIYVL